MNVTITTAYVKGFFYLTCTTKSITLVKSIIQASGL